MKLRRNKLLEIIKQELSYYLNEGFKDVGIESKTKSWLKDRGPITKAELVERDSNGYYYGIYPYSEDKRNYGIWGHVGVFDENKERLIADLTYGESPSNDDYLEVSVEVAEPYRRRGVATKMYDMVEDFTGKKIKPSPKHSKDAEAFWKNRDSSWS